MWICWVALSLTLLLSQASAWAGEKNPQSGGTLIYGRGADSVSLEPGTSDDLESTKVLDNVYEGLVRTKDDSTDVEPSLAVSWETSPDGLQWTFRLRPDVRFHDGTPFNADAVVYSFLRQIDPKHPGFRDHFKCASFTFQNVKRVEAVNPSTVRIILEKPYAPFLQNMAMVYARIVSPVAAARWGDEFGRHPVGTGPFKFVEWVPGDRIILEKNDDYWDTPPYLSHVVFKSIIDNRDRLLALKTGAIHMMDGIGPESAGEILRAGDLHLDRKAGLNVAYLAMNLEKKPFDQLKVRQAVNHAVNKQNLVKLLYRDLAMPAKNPIPPTMWGYAEEVSDYEYSLSRAKELLREAGYEQGFEANLWVMQAPRPYMPEPMELARLIKTNLAAAGIRLNIVSHEWDAYLSKVSNGEHDMCLLGWLGDNGDPDNFLYVLLDQDNAEKPKAENVSFWRNAELHDLLTRAQQTTDQKERTGLYIDAQKIVRDQAPWVPLAHVQQMIAYNKRFHGVVQHPFGSVRFQNVWKETN